MKSKSQEWYAANQTYLIENIFQLLNNLENSSSASFQSENKKITWSLRLPSNVDLLVQKFSLSDFERSMVLLAAGCELSGECRNRISRIIEKPKFGYLTLQNVFSILNNAHWDAISPNGVLRKNNLIKLYEGEPLLNRKFTLEENILQFLTGFSSLGTALIDICHPYLGNLPIVESHKELVNYVFRSIQHNRDRKLIVINGNTKDKAAIANECSKKMNCKLFTINSFSLPETIAEINKLAKEWNRTAVLNDLALYIECEGIDLNNANNQKMLHHLLLNVKSLVFVGNENDLNLYVENKLDLRITKPKSCEQKKLWRVLLPDCKNSNINTVELFNLSTTEIVSVAEEYTLKLESSDDDINQHELLRSICTEYASPDVNNLAYKLDVKAQWNDLVLPLKSKNLLREISNHFKYKNEVFEQNGFNNKLSRNKGLTVLFTGESGTGKTMAAEVLANELKLNLFRIDLSQIFNKYIGETEKNLKRIFDAAEAGGCMLLFDEADAIFGKRSEVKDSNSRFSNIQIGYLLQRMEEFEGVAVLTSNMKNSFDNAFERRIRFIIHFERPVFEQRKAIWESAFPDETPIKDLKYDQLAKVNVSGGNIKNIALNASFLAASNGKTVTMDHLAAATISEFTKMGKNLSQSELNDWV